MENNITKKNFLEGGKIVGAHGVRGVVKLESWCDTPKVLAAQKRIFLAEKDGGFKEVRTVSASVSGSIVLMGLECCDNRETAQAMKGTVIYLAREDIPLKNGAILLADIIGLPAIDIDSGRVYGRVADIQDAVTSRLYVIETENGKNVLIPDVKEFIKEIKIYEGVFIRPIPGFFD